MRFHRAFQVIAVTAFALSASQLMATVIPPSGLAPGSQYQLIFVTAGARDAISSNINDYNTFVTNEAAASVGMGLPSTTWRAIASTATVNANVNAPSVLGLPVYNTLGQLFKSPGNLYTSAIPINAPNGDQFGNVSTATIVWTGTTVTGTAQIPLGGTSGLYGDPQVLNGSWINTFLRPQAELHPLYALSGALTVPVPEPASWLLMGLGTVTLVGRRRMRRPGGNAIVMSSRGHEGGNFVLALIGARRLAAKLIQTASCLSAVICFCILPHVCSAANIPGLYNSGTDNSRNALPGGANDPHYTVVALPAKVLSNPPSAYSPNILTPGAAVKWIWQQADGQPTSVTRNFDITFDLTGLNPATAEIHGLWAVDNEGQIFLNGVNTINSLTAFNNFSTPVPFNIPIGSNFRAGPNNVLEFRAKDLGGVAGLYVRFVSGTAVPEPTSVALIFMGLTALVFTPRNYLRR